MRKFLLLVGLLVGLSTCAHAQSRERLSGWCEQGNWQVTTDGRQSTTRVQRSYSSCTVTVYDAGTTDLASIASDYGGTPKANPFTASTTGFWDFFAVDGRYDVRLSGSGITSPFTIPGLWIRSGGGGGGAPVDATYVVMSLNSTLTSERKLTAGNNVTITDDGPNGNVTVSAAPTDPGNPDTSIQSNQGGDFYGDLGLLYNFTTDTVSIGESSSTDGTIAFKNNTNAFITSVAPGGTPTSSFTIRLFQALPASGTECVQINSSGQLSSTGSACGSGGSGPGTGTVPYAAYWDSTTTLGSSSGITFTPTKATITSAKIITEFQDTNGNSWIKVLPVASAVNQVTVSNEATGNAPKIFASGTDTNINLDFDTQGTGEIRWRAASYSVPVTLVDTSTIATDASASNRFVVTVTADRTLGNPTNAQDNQQVVWTVIQDGTGGWAISFDTQFSFGAEITSCDTSVATANQRSFITAIYSASATKWFVVGCVNGYN